MVAEFLRNHWSVFNEIYMLKWVLEWFKLKIRIYSFNQVLDFFSMYSSCCVEIKYNTKKRQLLWCHYYPQLSWLKKGLRIKLLVSKSIFCINKNRFRTFWKFNQNAKFRQSHHHKSKEINKGINFLAFIISKLLRGHLVVQLVLSKR